jgi:ABC-type antimicrobial peptide transport system permease subunit
MDAGKAVTLDTYVREPLAEAFQTRSMLAILFQRLKRSKSAIVGLILVLALLLVAIFADVIARRIRQRFFRVKPCNFRVESTSWGQTRSAAMSSAGWSTARASRL